MDEDIYKAVTAEYPQYLVAYDQLISTPADMRSVTVGPSKDFYYAIMQGVSDMLENDQTVEETGESIKTVDETTLADVSRQLTLRLLSGDGRYPMLMRTEKVAARIMHVLRHPRRRVVIDRRYALMVFFWKLIPEWLWERLNIRKDD